MDTLPIPGTTGGRQSPRDYSTRFSGGSTRADRPRAAGAAELRRGASPRIWEGDAAVSGPDRPRTLGRVLPASVHPRLLLVDDDPNLLVFLADRLRDDGFTVTTARNGREALRRLDEEWPDLLVVDLLMPEMDGLTLAGQVKERADLPIIVLSAIDTGDSKADALERVAEDYVAKPFHYPELRARITRVLHRLRDRVPRQPLVLGPELTLLLHRREAIVAGQTVGLTPTEVRLLYALAANVGQVVSSDTLLARGWSETDLASPSYLWVTIRRLRAKLEREPDRPVHLVTVRGVGYRLERTTGVDDPQAVPPPR